MPIIYLAVWPNGNTYIGQTISNLERLTKRYAGYARSKRKTKRASEMACRLYGEPVFHILETCSPNKLDEREQYWIGVYTTYPGCLNYPALQHQTLMLIRQRWVESRTCGGENNCLHRALPECIM
jgi:hypothetical protein